MVLILFLVYKPAIVYRCKAFFKHIKKISLKEK